MNLTFDCQEPHFTSRLWIRRVGKLCSRWWEIITIELCLAGNLLWNPGGEAQLHFFFSFAFFAISAFIKSSTLWFEKLRAICMFNSLPALPCPLCAPFQSVVSIHRYSCMKIFGDNLLSTSSVYCDSYGLWYKLIYFLNLFVCERPTVYDINTYF